MPIERENPNVSGALESVAGFTAGVASTVVSHPLDVIKTRLQADRVSRVFIGSSLRTFRSIVHNEGHLSAFYRGLAPNLLGNSVSWALYFRWYAKIKATFAMSHGYTPGAHLGPAETFTASIAASSLTALCTNPIWVLKTRMLSTGIGAPGAYSSMTEGCLSIMRHEGIAGFYKGLLPSLLGTSHGAIQFVIYEELKHRLSQQSDGQHDLSNLDFLFMSGVSKIIAGASTYPYQVVRTRLQMHDANQIYNSTANTILQIWSKEGWKGFYKGLGPNTIRVLPSTCITFLAYENVRYYLPLFGLLNTENP